MKNFDSFSIKINIKFTGQKTCPLCAENMCGSRGGGGGGQGVQTHLENYKNIGFLNNTGPDPLKNHKATKPEFYVGPSSLLSSTKKQKKIKVGPPLTKVSEFAHGKDIIGCFGKQCRFSDRHEILQLNIIRVYTFCSDNNNIHKQKNIIWKF